jgi:hypothetical protein
MKALPLVLLLAACGPNLAERQEKTTNREYIVDLLFTHDGCSIYRFSDSGTAVYYVRCDDHVNRVEWTTTTNDGNGNTTSEHHEVPTSRRVRIGSPPTPPSDK